MNGRYVYANAAAEKAFNTPREKLYGRTDEDIFPREAAEQFRKNDMLALKDEKGVQIIETLMQPDGILHFSLVSKFPIPGPDGSTTLIGGTAFDVTERLRAEEALRESEERFRAILRQATAGIVRKDAEGHLIFVNEAFCNMLGYTEAELLGKTVWEFMHPDDVAENKKSYDRLMLEGIPFKLERRFLREDGSVIWVDASVSPIMDSNGKPQSAVAVEVDITGRKRSEELLYESERRFREMINALPTAIYTTDAEGQITHFNPAAVEFSGRVPELGTDQWCVTWKLYHPDGTPMPHEQCPMAIALKEGRVVRGSEAIAERPDGTRIWFEPYPTPLYDSEGRIVGGINMLVDITERKKTQEALQESEERFRAILRQATAGIVRKDSEGKLIFVNEAFCNMLGYTESELTGKTVWEFMHPDDVAENRRSYDRLMLEGIPFKLERRFIRRDGSVIWIDASVSPIMDAYGKPQSAVAVEVDITARKLAEDALRQLNLQLEDRVLSRTAKLRAVNQTLREEIAERQKVEEALRKSEAAARENEEKLRTLFELVACRDFVPRPGGTDYPDEPCADKYPEAV